MSRPARRGLRSIPSLTWESEPLSEPLFHRRKAAEQGLCFLLHRPADRYYVSAQIWQRIARCALTLRVPQGDRVRVLCEKGGTAMLRFSKHERDTWQNLRNGVLRLRPTKDKDGHRERWLVAETNRSPQGGYDRARAHPAAEVSRPRAALLLTPT
jgi:hypothetical protein